MDWHRIRQLLCDARRFSEVDGGCSVIADTMMPSGGVIEIFMQPDHDLLTLHDGGAAFDELAREGREVRSLRGARNLLGEIGLRLTDEGTIFMDRVAIDKVAVGVAVLADASQRTAQYLLQHAVRQPRVRLDQRVKDTLMKRFPLGKSEYVFDGKRRQHVFDFGTSLDGKTLLVEAVTPELSSIGAAILKSIDAHSAERGNPWPILIYDSDDDWDSASLGLLSDNAHTMAFSNLASGNLVLA